MSLVIIYKLYKSFSNKEDKRVSKNKNTLIRNKYLKKISI